MLPKSEQRNRPGKFKKPKVSREQRHFEAIVRRMNRVTRQNRPRGRRSYMNPQAHKELGAFMHAKSRFGKLKR